jgi:hypothetical protein
VLEADGLVWVADLETKPPNATPSGWHVALALKREGALTNFHFLRLDGDRWVHKWSTLPPQACDLDGAPIPREGILGANLGGYLIAAFFWVEPPIRMG